MSFTKSNFSNIFWRYFDFGLYSTQLFTQEFPFSFNAKIVIEAQQKSTAKTLLQNYLHLVTVHNTFTETEI